MKKIFKWTYNQTILLFKTLMSLMSVVFFSSFSAALNFKKNYKNTNDNKTSYLLGNGFSLKKVFQENPSMFNDKQVFVVNLFYETPFFEQIKPNNYFIADSGFWEFSNVDRIIKIQSDFKKKLLEVNWNMNLFIPNDGFKILSKTFKANDNIKLIPYNRTPVDGYKFVSHFLYKNNFGMPRPTNVLNAAIFVAINSDYNNIYLYGADHSWVNDLFVDENNDVCCYQNHFYDDKKDVIKLEKGTLADGLRGIVEAFDSYKILNDYAIAQNCKITNKTKGSFLDVFDNQP